jgi:hypothetical protein
MEQHALKNVNNFLNTNIYSYLETARANVIELFTAVIYHHSMVILSFCVIKLYYPENCHGMAVNYHGILTLEKVG